MALSESERVRQLSWKKLIKYIDKNGTDTPERKQALHVLQLRLSLWALGLTICALALTVIGIVVTILINFNELISLFK